METAGAAYAGAAEHISLGDDILSGVAAIAAFINEPERRTYYLLRTAIYRQGRSAPSGLRRKADFASTTIASPGEQSRRRNFRRSPLPAEADPPDLALGAYKRGPQPPKRPRDEPVMSIHEGTGPPGRENEERRLVAEGGVPRDYQSGENNDTTYNQTSASAQAALRPWRERRLLERAADNLEALGEILAELAIVHGSLDGSVMFGPIRFHGGLEIVARIRPQHEGAP